MSFGFDFSSLQEFLLKNECRMNLITAHFLEKCRGAMNNKGAWSFGNRRGLLGYVYNGVFV